MARPAPSSTSSTAATKRRSVADVDGERDRELGATQCADPACAEVVEQAPTGRRRLFCDATCRANARRARVWRDYDAQLRAWSAANDEGDLAFDRAHEAWRAIPYDPEPEWAVQAQAHGWRPPSSYRRTRPAPEPRRVRVPQPMPPTVSRPRVGAKLAGGYW